MPIYVGWWYPPIIYMQWACFDLGRSPGHKIHCNQNRTYTLHILGRHKLSPGVAFGSGHVAFSWSHVHPGVTISVSNMTSMRNQLAAKHQKCSTCWDVATTCHMNRTSWCCTRHASFLQYLFASTSLSGISWKACSTKPCATVVSLLQHNALSEILGKKMDIKKPLG